MLQRSVFLFVVLLLALFGLYFAIRPYVSFEALVAHEAWLRNQTTAHPVAAFGTIFVGFVVLSLIPGLTGKSIVVGWLLGFLPALLVVNLGLSLAALIMFLLSRYLLHNAVRPKLAWLIGRLDRGLRDSGGGYLVALRLFHSPFSATNYAVGATNIGVRQFWWTTQLGLLPGNIVFVLAGASLPSLRELSEQGPWSFVNVPLLVGLTLVGALPIFVRWAVTRRGFVPPKAARG